MTTDSISDFLTRIRNASHARRRDFTIQSSRMLKSIAEIFAAKRFIDSVDELPSENNRKELRITLRTDREPLNLKRVSKPGQRIYVGYDKIKRIRNGLGAAIISTSHGLMVGEEAKQQKLGGEYICDIY
jgi:small subunit ribosomal protein S8